MVGPMLDAMPNPVFLVDADVAISSLNQAAEALVGENPKQIIRRRAGEILHCIHSQEAEAGCGRSEFCSDCLVRNSVTEAFEQGTTVRENAKLELVTPQGVEEVYLSIIASPFGYEHQGYVLLQLENVTELMALRRVIPICSVCNKVRNDDEYWHRLETFFDKHLALKFSHGICPECLKSQFPELVPYVD
jgi:nitrogen-specific signal transduction histidine kinase